MGIDNTGDVDRVRDATDLLALISEHVSLRAKGREHIGLCPFHEDHRPSFAVVTHKGAGFYKCFACGAGGDCFRFVMDYHRMGFGEALRFLADRAGITLTPRSAPGARHESREPGTSREELLTACAGASRLFHRWLLEDERCGGARAYLDRRGVSAEMIETFNLGAAPAGYDALLSRLGGRPESIATAVAAGLLKTRDGGGHYDAFRHRVIFPIADDAGRPIAFGARALDADDQPKYLNSPETGIFRKSATLYGLDLARRSIIRAALAIVVEGYTDVLACHQAGITNVVGTLGTALTPEHARKLARLEAAVTLVFDGDTAGIKAAERAVAICFAEPIAVRICVLPDGMDPDEFLRTADADAFRQVVAEAPEALDYDFERFRVEHGGATDPATRERLALAYLDRLAQLGLSELQGVRRQVYVARIADLVGMSVEALDRELAARRPRRTSRADGTTAGSVTHPDVAFAPDHVGRARRIAEHTLLGIALAAPEVVVSDAGATALEGLREPRAVRISAQLLEARASTGGPTIAAVLADLDDASARTLAIHLYDEAEALLVDTDPMTAWHEAVATLDRVIARENAATTANHTNDLLSAVAAARAAGDRPDAISTRFRE